MKRSILLTLLLLVACDGDSGMLTATPLTQLTTKVAHTVDLADRRLAPYFWLSPDGTKLLTLTISGVQAMLYDLQSDKGQPLDLGVDSIDPASISFAPDSGSILYSEDFLRQARQSDVHLYDLKLHKATTLTSFRRNTPSSSHKQAELARFAAWSPLWSVDGKAIYYASMDEQGYAIYSLPRYGNEAAHKSFALGQSEGLVTSFGLTTAGKRLVYVLATSKAGLAGVYLWQGAGVGRQLLADPQAANLRVVGEIALLEEQAGEFVSSNKLASTLSLEAGREGERVFIKPFPIATTNTPPEVIAGASTHAATWSPDGKLAAYVTDNKAIRSQPAHSIWLYDPASKQAAMVYQATGSSSERELLPEQAALTWSAANTLAVNGEPGKIVILQLAKK